MADADHADLILNHVARSNYKPVTTKGLAKRLQIGPEDYAAFRQTVKQLVRNGQLDVTKERKLEKPSALGLAQGNAIVGTFRRNAKGFGFVRPLKSTDRSRDIFIPPDEGMDASTGDEVAITITRKKGGVGMQPMGRVTRIVSRATGQFVGTYFERPDGGYVKVDGTTFHMPIYVGDAGAKGAKDGDKVAFEMVSYPRPDREGEGVIVEVLGPKGQPGIDTLTVIRAFGIPDTFDEATLQDAREEAKRFDENDVEGRADLRELLTVTIDPANARDFDDAISLTRDETGFWQLAVHVADVSHFVREGSDLDRTARKRGTSVYLPDRVIPMLPEVLSNSLASLQAGHTRYTMTAFLEFDPDGVRTDTRFARSAIRVDQRFSYEQAFEAMMKPDEPIEGIAPEVRGMLSRMLELAMILRKRRFRRGALELTMPEVKIDLGDVGEVTGAHLVSSDESHQVIEEFMLAANEAVSEHLHEQKAAFIRRTHADPDPNKLRQFAEFARSLGLQLDSPQSRFELQRILDETADKPERYAVHFAFLRSLKQAIYSVEVEGHYALASEHYCHFTSPIRRYPDLQVHRQLGSLLAGKRPKGDIEELALLAEHCSKTERRAETAERELVKIKLLTHLEQKIGEKFHALIIGVEDFGFFCQLVELPVEGLVHVTSLHDDFYDFDAPNHALVGKRSKRRFRLGDKVEVVVAHVDVDRRELDLVLEESYRPGETGKARRPRGTPGRVSARPERSMPTDRPKRPKLLQPKPKGKKKRKG